MKRKGSALRVDREDSWPTVYVIDPDPSIQASMVCLLGTLGIHSAVFETAAEFFDALDPRAGACVITELHLPDMSGLEIQERLAEHDADIPVIILASDADVPTAVSAMNSGVFDFIEKPFVNRVLLDRIRKALGRRPRGERTEMLGPLHDHLPREARRDS
jgi:FixJ family two-component response regulator